MEQKLQSIIQKKSKIPTLLIRANSVEAPYNGPEDKWEETF